MTAAEYVRRVDGALRDLPWAERQNLAAELRDHLAELPVDTDLVERLGAPETYAADLRAAEGLERRHGAIAFLRARRPRNLALALLAASVLGFAIGAVVWIQTYQPLRAGDTTIVPNGTVETPGHNSESVTFRQGKPFEVGVEITNTGSFAIHVLGASVPPAIPLSPPGIGAPTNLPVVAQILVSPPLPPHTTVGPFTPLRPFDLEPGQTRLLLLKGVYGNCRDWVPGAIGGIDELGFDTASSGGPSR